MKTLLKTELNQVAGGAIGIKHENLSTLGAFVIGTTAMVGGTFLATFGVASTCVEPVIAKAIASWAACAVLTVDLSVGLAAMHGQPTVT